MRGPALGPTLPWLAGCFVLVIALCLLRRPLGSLLRLTARTGVGLAFLSLFAPLGNCLGLGLGVNLFNALVLGALGVPGFGLLMLLKWTLHT